ncbi:protein kinase [Streptosporangium sp. NBC_01495]|uniref:protein kinase domain-containing protein n=1 Tax=Streptosporangium sp. NBC_01495 TaxID=2903899 RepID=UPI002E35096E|nr:protein kinase [Streptosporangium sp. NBC_01495]
MRVAQELIVGDPWRLGGYRLAGRLGTGALGVVYEGYDPAGGRVAVRVLHDPSGRDASAEAAAACRVVSPCTANVLDADLDGPRPYVVSEYVEGPSLRRAGRIFAGDDLHGLATAVATALTALHDAGVVHRGLTPGDVILGRDGPRVTGFGMAPGRGTSLTATGLRTRVPSYTAPEVFTGGAAGPAADVFAWGGIVLYAATGEDPFAAGSLGGTMHRILSLDPDLDPLPPLLRPLASVALARDPRARPAARDLLIALLAGGAPGPRTVTTAGPQVASLLRSGAEVAAGIRTACDDPGLGALAESAYAALGPADRERAPGVFLRLVAIAPDGQPVAREARVPAGSERVLRGFAGLVAHRGDEATLVHQALPYAWPRLGEWIEADRARLVARGMFARLLSPLLVVSAVLALLAGVIALIRVV